MPSWTGAAPPRDHRESGDRARRFGHRPCPRCDRAARVSKRHEAVTAADDVIPTVQPSTLIALTGARGLPPNGRVRVPALQPAPCPHRAGQRDRAGASVSDQAQGRRRHRRHRDLRRLSGRRDHPEGRPARLRNAAHSARVKLRTGPSGSRLSRMPTVLPGSSATSTQLPLAKLKELLTQRAFTCSLLMAGCGQLVAVPVRGLRCRPGSRLS